MSTVRPVSAADANRNFSRILREVRRGRTVTVTSHGRPVARLVPYETESDTRGAARGVLFERLARQRVTNAGRWTRESLYMPD